MTEEIVFEGKGRFEMIGTITEGVMIEEEDGSYIHLAMTKYREDEPDVHREALYNRQLRVVVQVVGPELHCHECGWTGTVPRWKRNRSECPKCWTEIEDPARSEP